MICEPCKKGKHKGHRLGCACQHSTKPLDQIVQRFGAAVDKAKDTTQDKWVLSAQVEGDSPK